MLTAEITAAVMVIGDEILSGRTQDTNSNTIAKFLQPLGIALREIRTIGDDEETIVETVNELRCLYTYVFTTGGIGPTHDDITADSIAKAFGAHIDVRDDAVAMMLKRYKREDLNEARLRMARIPDGASLLDNPISFAPGFQLGNVFVMAGVPTIMKAMLEDIAPRLKTGKIVISKTVKADGLQEGIIAEPLATIAHKYPELSFGSYPWFKPDSFGTQLVIRGSDEKMLHNGVAELVAMLKDMGFLTRVE